MHESEIELKFIKEHVTGVILAMIHPIYRGMYKYVHTRAQCIATKTLSGASQERFMAPISNRIEK